MGVELELLKVWWQPVIDQIVDNCYTMIYNKGGEYSGSGNLAQSIEIGNLDIVKEDATSYIVELTFPMYAAFVDEGVKGYENKARTTGDYQFKRNTKNIPTSKIREFMRNRSIVPRDEAGNRVKLTNPEEQLNYIAYKIGKKIKRDGIDYVPIISSVINEKLINQYIAYVGTIFGEKVKRDLIVTFQTELVKG